MNNSMYQQVYEQAEERVNNRELERKQKTKQIACLKNKQDFEWSKIESVSRLAVRASQLGMEEEAAKILSNPKDKITGNRIFEKIIDANNLLDISFLQKGAQMARAVGRIVLPVSGGNRLGTGFMVSPQIMMTNNHVLSNSMEAGNARLEFDFYQREDDTTGPITTFQLKPDLFFATDNNLDFTLIAIELTNADGINAKDRGWFPLIRQSGKALAGERVSIIQHPNGDPQKVTLHDNEVVDVMENDDFLHYKTDTMGGASGSPVLNINWDLVALHHAAVASSNEGIRISSILRRLDEIFNQESLGSNSNMDAILFSELIESKPSPTNGNAGIPPKTPIFNNECNGNPEFDGDGTAKWTIPLTVTIGVGQIPKISNNKPNAETPKIVNTDLTTALQALENTKNRVYYSKVQDNIDIKSYYPDLTGLNPKQLFETLSELMSSTHTTSLSYKNARLNHLYPWIDRRDGTNRQLRGIYSNKVFDALEMIKQEAEMEMQRQQITRERFMESFQTVDESFLEELEAAFPFNCEHVVPQSWFNKEKQPKTDLHHLFTCEWGCNSFRSNHAYFEFGLEAFRENCGENSKGKFEPKNGKGAVARATLYFLLRYPKKVSNSNKEMPIERIQTVIDWAKNDKIDRWERHRNAEIFKVQGNRNPFIDFPDLVDKIDFSLGFA